MGRRRRRPRCGSPSSPATRWSTSTPTRRSADGSKSRSTCSRLSTPSRYSTTTPSTRRSAPHTFSTSSASCRPSTKIRLPRATCARVFSTATDPDAVRSAPNCGPAAEPWAGAALRACRRSGSPGPIGKSRTLPRRSSSRSSRPSYPTTAPTKPVATSSTTRSRTASTTVGCTLGARRPKSASTSLP